MTGAETGTPPPADLVARVFELGAVREPPTFAARGELGFVWRLSTDRGTWAVKVLLDPVTAATGGDAAFQLALHAAGLPLPRPRLARTGSAVITGPDGVGYRLYEWLDLDPGRRVEPDTAGHLLGRIHATAWPAHEVAPWFHEPVPDDTWRGLIDAARAAGEPWCEPLASRLDEILATTAAITPGPPPQMIGCHLDFNHDNVLVDLTGRPWVIDWENSGGGDPLQELAQSLHEFAGGDSDAARAMLAAYRAAGAPAAGLTLDSFSMAFAVQANLLALYARRALTGGVAVRARASWRLGQMLAHLLTVGVAERTLDHCAGR